MRKKIVSVPPLTSSAAPQRPPACGVFLFQVIIFLADFPIVGSREGYGIIEAFSVRSRLDGIEHDLLAHGGFLLLNRP